MPALTTHFRRETSEILYRVAQEMAISPGKLVALIVSETLSQDENVPVTGSAPVLADLSASCLRTLEALRRFEPGAMREGRATAAMLAGYTGQTVLATHMHLVTLRERGLVAGSDRGTIGSNVWLLAEHAGDLGEQSNAGGTLAKAE